MAVDERTRKDILTHGEYLGEAINPTTGDRLGIRYYLHKGDVYRSLNGKMQYYCPEWHWLISAPQQLAR